MFARGVVAGVAVLARGVVAIAVLARPGVAAVAVRSGGTAGIGIGNGDRPPPVSRTAVNTQKTPAAKRRSNETTIGFPHSHTVAGQQSTVC